MSQMVRTAIAIRFVLRCAGIPDRYGHHQGEPRLGMTPGCGGSIGNFAQVCYDLQPIRASLAGKSVDQPVHSEQCPLNKGVDRQRLEPAIFVDRRFNADIVQSMQGPARLAAGRKAASSSSGIDARSDNASTKMCAALRASGVMLAITRT